MKLGLGILGLGVQGRRMIARLAEHDRVQAVAAWDPSPASVKAMGASGLPITASADALIGTAGVDCVYIASPPASHMELASRVFDAGLPAIEKIQGRAIVFGRREPDPIVPLLVEQRELRSATLGRLELAADPTG